MSDYTKAIIYKLVCKDLNITDCYVGSTTNFKHRKICHKSSCTNLNDKKYNFKIYEFIRDNGGWNNWDLIMVEEFPCDNKLQLHKREREVIETLKATLNCDIPSRTQKEYKKQYYKDNNEKCKQYREANKEKFNEAIGCRICKIMVMKRNFKIHKKSKKHINNLKTDKT